MILFEEGIMSQRKILRMISRILFISLLFLPLFAQWEDVCNIKDVQLPFNLKYEDKIIKKGKYVFELLKHTGQTAYYLRIKKGSDRLCLVSGEYLQYRGETEIPDKPTLRMRKNPADKMLYIIIETGTVTWQYPKVKVRFKIEYEE